MAEFSAGNVPATIVPQELDLFLLQVVTNHYHVVVHE